MPVVALASVCFLIMPMAQATNISVAFCTCGLSLFVELLAADTAAMADCCRPNGGWEIEHAGH